jgi:hypothetical protein
MQRLLVVSGIVSSFILAKSVRFVTAQPVMIRMLFPRLERKGATNADPNLVAMTIRSRLPLSSIQSPIHSSDSSSSVGARLLSVYHQTGGQGTNVLTVNVGCVNRVSTSFKESVEQLVRLLFIHRAHEVLPCFTDGHAAQEKRRDPVRDEISRKSCPAIDERCLPDSGFRGKDPPSRERAFRLGSIKYETIRM